MKYRLRRLIIKDTKKCIDEKLFASKQISESSTSTYKIYVGSILIVFSSPGGGRDIVSTNYTLNIKHFAFKIHFLYLHVRDNYISVKT